MARTRQQRRRLEKEPENARHAEGKQENTQDGAKERARDPATSTGTQEEDAHFEGHDKANDRVIQGDQEQQEADEDKEADEDEGQLLLTEYEKEREIRIKENAAKLASLNLPTLASSFAQVSSPRLHFHGKSTIRKGNDEDYMPRSSSDGDDSDDSYEEVTGQNNHQALPISLGAPVKNANGTRKRALQSRKGEGELPDKIKIMKKQKKGQWEPFTSDDIAVIFAIIDEQGTGKFSAVELERIVRAHDFTWSKQEISDMIDIFDTNNDGKLDLSEFQCIFGRMKMFV